MWAPFPLPPDRKLLSNSIMHCHMDSKKVLGWDNWLILWPELFDAIFSKNKGISNELLRLVYISTCF